MEYRYRKYYGVVMYFIFTLYKTIGTLVQAINKWDLRFRFCFRWRQYDDVK